QTLLSSVTSATGAWKHLELDLPSSSVDLRLHVTEKGDAWQKESLIEGAVPLADFLAAAKQDLSVAIRTPLSQRRLYANQRVSLLVHFRILPERASPSPPTLPLCSPPSSPIRSAAAAAPA
ncbi:hypothetical protein PFISCL1PPCAC_12166, partial [Pristionchus fissidentatus]